jgi:serine/threonine protein kinase
LGLSVNSFFHQGGDVTEWKLGKLEDCKVVDDYLGDCDVIETTAPEVLNNQETNVTKESSIWSLGVVIYELVAGEPLFKTMDVARQFAKSGKQPNLDTVNNENAMLLLAKMLVLKPMQRGNIEELFHFWEAHEEHADHEDDDDISSIEG